RYRYTGKERDEESGLSYHGARYYAPWVGRWTSCEPELLTDGNNAYCYVRGMASQARDPSGLVTDTALEVQTETTREERNRAVGEGLWFAVLYVFGSLLAGGTGGESVAHGPTDDTDRKTREPAMTDKEAFRNIVAEAFVARSVGFLAGKV